MTDANPDGAEAYATYLGNMMEWFRSRWDVPDLDWRYDDEDSSMWGVVKGMEARFWIEMAARGSTRTYFPTLVVKVDGFDEAKMTATASAEVVAAAKRGEYLASERAMTEDEREFNPDHGDER